MWIPPAVGSCRVSNASWKIAKMDPHQVDADALSRPLFMVVSCRFDQGQPKRPTRAPHATHCASAFQRKWDHNRMSILPGIWRPWFSFPWQPRWAEQFRSSPIQKSLASGRICKIWQPRGMGIVCSIHRPSTLPAVRASAHPWWAVHAIQAWEELIFSVLVS